ncbi:hypothetical protein NG895_11685 [Aeoliella sp. ICT_H6.2]|uniref:Secreted protein n=1 Tax=Aeoliella straminimaris TaxID=2954799 RepID=A0A9X2FAD7_9BACT|nr:hypothetical protein [Aeoliella straminimaris]MCO6044568.1 hypothetical protein [Aeoliella straminimaris]
MRTVLAAGLLLFFVGVVQAQPPASEMSSQLVVLSDQDSHVTIAGFGRIDSPQRWTRVWLEHLGLDPRYDTPNRAAMEVDFERCMVVAIFGGTTANTAGYKVASVIETTDSVVVRFEANTSQSAGPDGGAERTTPYAFVVLPKTNKPIVMQQGVRQYIGEPPTWKHVAELPPVTKTLEREEVSLSHPERVEIPADIPFLIVRNAREKDGTVYKQRLFASISYQTAHHEAWQDCLQWVASPYHKMEDFRLAAPQTNNQYLLRGLKDGAARCISNIQALRKAGVPDETIRKRAQRALVEVDVSPVSDSTAKGIPLDPVPPPTN